MINLLKLTIFGLVVTAFSYSNANAALTATGEADAEVVAPLAITGGTGGDSLNFGIFDNASAGTVLIDPSDGSVTTSLNHFGDNDRAEFSVTGRPGVTYSVNLPTSVTLSDGGGNSMTASNFTTSSVDTLVPGGDTFYVGATLSVASGQAVGTYSGTYSVTVAY